jgi:uncharacterized protein YcbK (DUF882 family)
MSEQPNVQIHRRRLLTGAAALVGAAAARPAMALVPPPRRPRSLKLLNANTGERMEALYFDGEGYDATALDELDFFMRDWRTGEVMRMDVGLYDLLHDIAYEVGHRGYLHIVSAYRTQRTNRMLRSRTSGVARNSFHTQGLAIDFWAYGVSLRDLNWAARRQQRGGVGYYPNSGFIHVDTGPVRYW